MTDLLPIEKFLKAEYKRLHEIDERRRLSDDRSDYSESFVATERFIHVMLRALLEHLDHPPAPNATSDAMIVSLRQLVPTFPQQLDINEYSASTAMRLLDELQQAIKDLAYFRAGLGLTSTSPRPDDMFAPYKGHPHTVAVNAFDSLVGLIRGSKSQLQEEASRQRVAGQLPPEPKVDYGKLFEDIVRAIGNHPSDVSAYMADIVGACREQVRSKAWEKFERLDFQRDVVSCSTLITDVFVQSPPTCRIEGFWFGISNPIREGEATADIYFMADDSYEATDDWPEEMKYEPLDSFAHSSVLAAIFTLSEETGLGLAAEYPLELAYSAFLARECVRHYKKKTTEPIGLCVGFDSGDLIHLGRVD